MPDFLGGNYRHGHVGIRPGIHNLDRRCNRSKNKISAEEMLRQTTHLEMDVVFLNMIKSIRMTPLDTAELISKDHERVRDGNHRQSMISIN
jgi:hypothetical protein